MHWFLLGALKGLSPRELFWGLFSLVGCVIGFVMAFQAINADPGASKYMIVALAVINFMLAGMCLINQRSCHNLFLRNCKLIGKRDENKERGRKLLGELELAERRKRTISEHLHNINHELRNKTLCFTEIKDLLISGAFKADYVSVFPELMDVLRTTDCFNIFFTANLKRIMDHIVDDDCSVSIKLLTYGDDDRDLYVKTLVRDPLSYRKRKGIDSDLPSFPVKKNTAFNIIMSESDRRSFYVCDDLSSDPEYVNMNFERKKFYNATIVMPIGSPVENGASSSGRYYGFICIDNMKGGFNDPSVIQFLASITDNLCNFYSIYGETSAMLVEMLEGLGESFDASHGNSSKM